jgi:hypothetical protein
MVHMSTRVNRRNSIAISVLSVALSLLFGGCAFSDGDPWGEVRFAVTAGLDASGRATDGGYRTSNDYLVQVESFEITFQDVSVTATTVDASAFDPANPPAGYSLCHNGHCHSDDGRLVDYEDIEGELAGANANGATTLQAIGAAGSLTETAVALPLDACSDDCRLSRGELGLASLRAGGARIRVHVTDGRSGERQRLPDAGATIELNSEQLFEWSSLLSERINGRTDPVVEIDLRFQVPVTVFDGVDWLEPDAQQELFSNLQSDAAIDVAIVRDSY